MQAGDSIHLDRVLLVAGDSGVQVGQPTLANTPRDRDHEAHGRGEKDSRVQAPPAQAFPQDHRSPAGFHRDRDYRHRRLTVQTRKHSWHIKKQAAARATAAIPTPAAGRQALRRRGGVDRQYSRYASAAPSSIPAPTSASAKTTRCSRPATAKVMFESGPAQPQGGQRHLGLNPGHRSNKTPPWQHGGVFVLLEEKDAREKRKGGQCYTRFFSALFSLLFSLTS